MSLDAILKDTSALITNLQSQEYPKEGIPGLPLDVHTLIFPHLNLNAVCALGSCNRSLFFMHYTGNIWKVFLDALGAPESESPSKRKYIEYYQTTWRPQLLKTVGLNLWHTSIVPHYGEDIVPRFIGSIVDLDQKLSTGAPKQLHGIGNKVYFRDDANVFILDAVHHEILKTIPIKEHIAFHIQNGMSCRVTQDNMIQVSCLASDLVFDEFQGPKLQSSSECGGFDIHICNPHVAIGYENGEILIWNFRTGTSLGKINAAEGKISSTLFTQEAFYLAQNQEITKWDPTKLTEIPQKISSDQNILSLSIHNNFLLAGDGKDINVYELFTLSHKTDCLFFQFDRERTLTSTFSFGNSILCQLNTSEGIEIDLLKTRWDKSKTQAFIYAKKMPHISSFSPLGIDQILIGMNDKKIHILDFGFPYEEISNFKKCFLWGLKISDIEVIENLYVRLPQKHKDILDALNPLKFDELLKKVSKEIEDENALRLEAQSCQTDEERNQIHEKVSNSYRDQLKNSIEELFRKFYS